MLSVNQENERKIHPACDKAIEKLQPTDSLKGFELLFVVTAFKGQLENLDPLEGFGGPVILIDMDAAEFRDDSFCVKTYLVEPGQEDSIPLPPDAGPRIVHIEKSVTPWMYLEAFQQA